MNKAELLMSQFSHLKYIYDNNMPPKLKGFCNDDVIHLNPNQETDELAGTIGEEIGHYLTGVGDIIDQKTVEEKRQEKKARDVGVQLVVTLEDIIDCYKQGLVERWECAEYLGITLKTLNHAISVYAQKKNGKYRYSHYSIKFHDSGIVEVFDWFTKK
jgi:Domain of unknown function (DUF955).